MKRFEGKCPKCENEELEERICDWQVDFVNVSFECLECGSDIDLIYDHLALGRG